MKAIVLAMALAAMAVPALADPVDLTVPTQGYSYFNRPGADMAAHDRELFECALEAAQTLQPEQNPRLVGDSGVAWLDGSLAMGYVGLPAKLGFLGSLENCMVVRGWRVVSLEKTFGRGLAKKPQPEIASMLKDWVGAQAPEGQVVRVWNNDALIGATLRLRSAERPQGTSLSFLARAPQPDDKARLDAVEAIPPPWEIPGYPAKPPKPPKPAEIRGLLADQAIVVIRLRGFPTMKGLNLHFDRQSTVSDEAPASLEIPGFNVALPFATYGPAGSIQEHTYVLAIPPGRWVLTQASRILFTERYCLGAPAFDAKAGEVIFAGTFEITAATWGPDLDLAPARLALSASPDALQRLKAASWVNGVRFSCSGSDLYNLEIPGAPYVRGYSWGGAAKTPS